MTGSTARTAAIPWVSLEGINGVGKTYLAKAAARALGRKCHLMCELPDTPQGSLPAAVIAALRRRGDLFLRTGMPLTETALLCALQIHRWESLGVCGTAQVVLEDRGPWSVAVYQAAVISPGSPSPLLMRQILDLISTWRPLPAATLLLLDEPGRCLDRFEQRIGREATPSERSLMADADNLYRRLADTADATLTVIDRSCISADECIDVIVEFCELAHRQARPGERP